MIPNMDVDGGYAWFSMESEWAYECVEPDDGASPSTWRIYPVDDPSYEATICELWSGEHDNEKLCEEICAAHNTSISRDGANILVLQPSGVEILIQPRSDGKWEMVNAKHHGDKNE